jgi:hypothetical protein
MRLIHSSDLHNPPGYRPILESDVHRDEPAKPSEPTPEHRERLSSAVRDLDQFRARKGHVGATWTSRKTGKTHTVGQRVSVNGHTGTVSRKHEASGLPVIDWDK